MWCKVTYRLVEGNEKSVSSLLFNHATISVVSCIWTCGRCLAEACRHLNRRFSFAGRLRLQITIDLGFNVAGSELSFSDGWTTYCLSTPPSKSVHGGNA